MNQKKRHFHSVMVVAQKPFHPVVNLPEEYWVFDFTRGEDKTWECPFEYQIGRYNEFRPGMYETEIFGGVRNIHVGIDIGAPVGTSVHAFGEGKIHSFGINPEEGSYGPTIITCLLYTSPSPRDATLSRMPSSA